MRPSAVMLIGFLVLPLIGCVPPPVYRVQRSVRAPHATVPLRTGQPLLGPVELTMGASNAVDLVRPRTGNENAAVEVPAHQMRGELRVRLRQNGELALIHERGIGSSAIKLDQTQAPIRDGDPHGTGFAIRYAIPAEKNFVIGIEMEALTWSLPYVEHRTCVEYCEGEPAMTIDHGRATEVTLGLGVTPSYQLGMLTLFGGAFLRHHPTIERKGTEVSSINHEDVQEGRMNLLVHAGAAYRFAENVTAILVIDQNVHREPVRYGPGLGLGLSFALR